MEENLVNDPVVTVEFMNLYFSVLGEVKTPGKYAITKIRLPFWKPSVWRVT